nr:hypothetical protein BHI3_34140 [Bacteriovorax sp. HI3]
MKTLIAVLALTASVSTFARSPIRTWEGTSRAWNASGNTAGLLIQGEAARVVFEKLSAATQTSKREGSLETTVRVGRDLKCSRVSAFVLNYSCELKIDETGAVGN